ncbi:hypothetical protein FACS18949_07520 [Clostridia bacterium]|nr:hypothetical protein FACS18949_07520 [Clostridia bacterium]
MKITVIGEEIIFVNDEARTLEYAVTSVAVSNMTHYGIRVRIGNGAAFTECSILPDLTTRRDEINSFASLLRRCRVTPISLKYIAQDHLPLSQLSTVNC